MTQRQLTDWMTMAAACLNRCKANNSGWSKSLFIRGGPARPGEISVNNDMYCSNKQTTNPCGRDLWIG